MLCSESSVCSSDTAESYLHGKELISRNVIVLTKVVFDFFCDCEVACASVGINEIHINQFAVFYRNGCRVGRCCTIYCYSRNIAHCFGFANCNFSGRQVTYIECLTCFEINGCNTAAVKGYACGDFSSVHVYEQRIVCTCRSIRFCNDKLKRFVCSSCTIS